jgi:hypothetical protein
MATASYLRFRVLTTANMKISAVQSHWNGHTFQMYFLPPSSGRWVSTRLHEATSQNTVVCKVCDLQWDNVRTKINENRSDLWRINRIVISLAQLFPQDKEKCTQIFLISIVDGVWLRKSGTILKCTFQIRVCSGFYKFHYGGTSSYYGRDTDCSGRPRKLWRNTSCWALWCLYDWWTEQRMKETGKGEKRVVDESK